MRSGASAPEACKVRSHTSSGDTTEFVRIRMTGFIERPQDVLPVQQVVREVVHAGHPLAVEKGLKFRVLPGGYFLTGRTASVHAAGRRYEVLRAGVDTGRVDFYGTLPPVGCWSARRRFSSYVFLASTRHRYTLANRCSVPDRFLKRAHPFALHSLPDQMTCFLDDPTTSLARRVIEAGARASSLLPGGSPRRVGSGSRAVARRSRL
jgi:hypothetical protein